jgi:hypothetical protein
VFILSSICSFSFAGMRIHLFQSECASASCLASSFVINYCRQISIPSATNLSTYIEPVPLFLAVVCSGSGLLDRRVYSNAHRARTTCEQQRLLKKASQALESQKAREAGDFRAPRSNPPLPPSLGRFLFFGEADVRNGDSARRARARARRESESAVAEMEVLVRHG